MASVPVRTAIVVVALAAVAWLALSVRALDLETEGRAVAALAQQRELSAAELERGRSAFDRAHRFNADKTPMLHKAFLLLTVGRGRESLALTEDVVADEPDNRAAWTVLYRVAQTLGNPAIEARAARAVRALDPRNAPAILGDDDG